jgi:choline dehydrogenase-like flavoprotein
MADTGIEAHAVFEHPLNDYKGVHVSRLIHDYYDSDPRRGFYGGGGIDARFDQFPIGFALGGLPPDLPRWGAGYKAALAEYFPRPMTLLAHTTCLARESNTIDLDPEVKDAWGLPALRMTFRNHPDDLKIQRFCLDRMKEILEAAGAKRIWSGEPQELTFTGHLMGGCRMGDDRRTSVVDRFHRTHEVPNLYLVDGSSFVTCARQQPTLTIAALAYRAAEHIAMGHGLMGRG